MAFNQFPYSNLHELNLDWVLNQIRHMETTLQNFIDISALKWADPVEWSIDRQYPRNNLVTYTNKVYAAVTNVPAGVLIDNNDYWQVVFDIQPVSEALANVEKELSILKTRRIVFISDSYGLTPSATNSWSYIAAQNMGILDRCFFGNYSGGGFAVNGNNQFLEALKGVAVPEDQKDLITDVVVGGGLNDAVNSDLAVVETGISDFCKYAKKTYKNARIWIGFMGNAKYGAPGVETLNQVKLLTMIQRYENNTGKNGAAYITNIEQVLHDWLFMGDDNIHPNALGSQMLANAVTAMLVGGAYQSASTGSFVKLTATKGTINTQSTTQLMGTTWQNGCTTWWNQPVFSFEFPTELTIGNDYVEIASVDSNVFFCNNAFEWSCMCQITGDIATTFVTVPMAFKIEQGKMYVRSLYINSTSYEQHKYRTITLPANTHTQTGLN